MMADSHTEQEKNKRLLCESHPAPESDKRLKMKSCCKEAFEQDVPEVPDTPKGKNVLHRLKQKWSLRNSFQVILILSTFAMGGSLAGLGGRKILTASSIDSGALWVLLYILLVSILWPVCVIAVGTVLGQRRFFVRFINRLLKKIGLRTSSAQNSR